MIKIIQENDLVNHTAKIGSRVYNELSDMSKSGAAQGKLTNLRGKGAGTFIAFDCETPAKRDAFIAGMRNEGVNMGQSCL